ncbi:MAG: hypothetical protein HZB51_28950 [Chloroflexi bacterium]|nr:hypothetical protein [Chloroflexota bacterium]
MTITQIFILTLVSASVTIPVVMLVPRARQSSNFDRVLWGATFLLAFIGAWGAPGFIPTNLPLSHLIVSDLSLVQIILGALAGALSINILLWIMDRFERPSPEADLSDVQDDTDPNSDTRLE